ncbi:MAG: MFS transporter [Spirochaetia bacterium]|nr:MFS transporter [Spirochaetia bacterium]
MKRRDLLLYSAGSTGLNLLSLFVMTKYLFYYDPKTGTPLLPMLWASLALTLSRVLEAVSDPLIGYWSDRSNSRFGRRRVFLFWGLPLTLLAFYFLWRPPFGPGENVWGNFLFLLVMTNVFFTAYTLYAIPFDAYLPEIAKNEGDRVRGSRYKALFAVAGILIAVPLLGGADVKSSSFYFLILSGATLLLPFWGMRSDIPRMVPDPTHTNNGWRETSKALFRDKKFLLYLAAVFFIEAACNMFLKYIDYFNLHVLSGVKHGLLSPELRHHLLYLCFILAMISGIPFWEWLSRKRNAFSALRAALILLALIFPASIGIGFLPAEGAPLSPRDAAGLLYFAGIGFGYGGVTVFGVAILSFFAGSALESSGLYFGLYNFVKKIGFSIGIAAFALFIESFEKLGQLETGFQGVGILMTLFLGAALLFVRKTGKG